MRRTAQSSGLRTLLSLSIICLLIISTSCTDNGTGPDDLPSQLVISRDSVTLVPDETVTLSASVLNARGDTLRGIAVLWSSSNDQVVQVSLSGEARGMLPGSAILTATADAARASVPARVSEIDTKNEVVVIDSTSLRLVSTGAERSDGILRLQASGPTPLPQFQVGEVIVGAEQGGFLARITSVTTSGNTVTLHTIPATLDEVMRAGDVSLTVTFGGSPDLAAAEEPGLRVSQPEILYQADGVNCSDGKCTLQQVFGGGASEATLTLNGSFTYDLSVDLDARYRFLSGLQSVEAGLRADLGLELSATLEASTSWERRDSVRIGQMRKWFYYQAGPVPVAGRIDVHFYAGYEAQASFSSLVHGETKGSTVTSVRAIYAEGLDWRFEFDPPNLDNLLGKPSYSLFGTADAGLRVFVRPKVELTLYELAGGHVALEPYTSLNAKFATNVATSLSLALGIDGEFGLALTILGTKLASYDHSFNIGEWTLLTLDHSTHRLVVVPQINTIPVGKAVQLSVMATDGNGNQVPPPSSINWVSSRNAVATVDAAGLVRSGSVGETTVTADAPGFSSGSSTVRVVAAAGPAMVYGWVRDLQTFQAIPNALLVLRNLPMGLEQKGMANSQGRFEFAGLSPGTYELKATHPLYKENVANNIEIVQLDAGDVVRLEFALPPATFSKPVGNVAGRILDTSSEPLAGAIVMISGGQQTNGVFKSTQSAEDGTYALSGIVLTDPSNKPISSFSIIAEKPGFAAQTRTNVPVAENKTTTNIDFKLVAASGGSVYFADDFESTFSWTATGFWNRTQGKGVVNTAHPTYVSLAPDDTTGGKLPAAISGSHYIWYGDPAKGNFLGQQWASDPPMSGGTSLNSNSGSVVSPRFTIAQAASRATLRFDTWFEIESVNPNDQGFDLMIVAIFDVKEGAWYEVGRLNPQVDPEIPNRAHIPFTSGGFNRAPLFRPVAAPIDHFIGREVQLGFIFKTMDEYYNGFRGWIIDNVRVTEDPPFAHPSPEPFTRLSDPVLLGVGCDLDLCTKHLSSSRGR